METDGKLQLVSIPDIPNSSKRVILEYVFANHTNYQFWSKMKVVDREPKTVNGKFLILNSWKTPSSEQVVQTPQRSPEQQYLELSIIQLDSIEYNFFLTIKYSISYLNIDLLQFLDEVMWLRLLVYCEPNSQTGRHSSNTWIESTRKEIVQKVFIHFSKYVL